jgi:hypothetical protein
MAENQTFPIAYGELKKCDQGFSTITISQTDELTKHEFNLRLSHPHPLPF